MLNIAHPLTITPEGLIGTTGYRKHIEHLIMQLLFTVPGERVNLPDFGTPLSQLVFSPGSTELTAATQFLIQGALQQWLGSLIQVQNVLVEVEDATMNITVAYIIKRTQEQYIAQFSRTTDV